MELELKHIAGYLPYGLNIMFNKKHKGELVGLLGNKWNLAEIKFEYGNDRKEIEFCFPILRPLSDLTKDEHFDLYMDLCEELGVVRCEHLLLALQDNLKYAFNLQDLDSLEEFMYKNHFDWKYNLIEKGLAIDINTLKYNG